MLSNLPLLQMKTNECLKFRVYLSTRTCYMTKIWSSCIFKLINETLMRLWSQLHTHTPHVHGAWHFAKYCETAAPNSRFETVVPIFVEKSNLHLFSDDSDDGGFTLGDKIRTMGQRKTSSSPAWRLSTSKDVTHTDTQPAAKRRDLFLSAHGTFTISSSRTYSKVYMYIFIFYYTHTLLRST